MPLNRGAFGGSGHFQPAEVEQCGSWATDGATGSGTREPGVQPYEVGEAEKLNVVLPSRLPSGLARGHAAEQALAADTGPCTFSHAVLR